MPAHRDSDASDGDLGRKVALAGRRLQTPIGVIGFLVFGAVGIRLRSHSDSGATSMFILSGLFIVSVAVHQLLIRRSSDQLARAVVPVRVDGRIALAWAADALRDLSPDGQIEVIAEPAAAILELPRGRKTFGERVVVRVLRDGPGSVLEVESRLLVSQVTDYGRNEALVGTVVRSLEARNQLA